MATNKDIQQALADSHNNLIVAMQAAFIEWKHGGGAESAMEWIVNTLRGPGLIPRESDPWGKEAQAYFSANQSNPMPTCFCGRPSHMQWLKWGFCSEAHYEQGKKQHREKR